MGFFYGDEAASKKIASSKIPLHTAAQLECRVCPRAKLKNQNPKMQPEGVDDPIIYILKAPVQGLEDLEGELLVTEGGKFLLSHLNEKWDDYIRINCILRCAGGTPTEVETTCCRNSIEEDIANSKPKIILSVGEEATKWLLGVGGVAKWRGRFLPIQIKNHLCWVYPILDPEWVLNQRKFDKRTQEKTLRTEYDHIFKKDIDELLYKIENEPLKEPVLYTKDYLKGILCIDGNKGEEDLKRIIIALKEAETWPEHALDLETNCLRPYEETPRILTVAIGTFDKTIAFPIHYRDYRTKKPVWNPSQLQKLEKAFKHYLLNSAVKVAHNTRFELEWLLFFYGEEVINKELWDDTMATCYTLDERRGMLSLDVLCFIYYGFHLKDLSNIDRKNMESYPLKDILPYNGMDTKWTHKLWLDTISQIKKERKLKNVHKQLIAALPTLTKAQHVGICINYDLRDTLEEESKKEAGAIFKQIKDLPDVKKYENLYGSFNPDSPPNIMKLLRDVMGLDEELMDKTGKRSTGEPVLKGLKNIKFVELLLKYRAVTKKASTYITPLVDHCFVYDGRIHTNFNLYETSTGRLSSNDPNMQNWPNRKGREIRRLIVAPEGQWIVASDYGQIEARIIGVASQDKNFCDALWNDYDVHMEWAERIAHAYPRRIGGADYLNDKKVMSTFRKDVKNQWVFPAFYGSSPNSISKGVNVPLDITQKLFKAFWSQFSGVKRWQKWITSFYDKHGYVETLTGRRRHGPMSYNMCINAPIQGTASDICVNAMNALSDAGYSIIMNIHDDITSYVKDDVLEESITDIARIMCDTPYDLIPNLNVPISIEISVGENWCDQEEVGVFNSTQFMQVDKTLRRIEDYV